jgi:hypothetical protein
VFVAAVVVAVHRVTEQAKSEHIPSCIIVVDDDVVHHRKQAKTRLMQYP